MKKVLLATTASAVAVMLAASGPAMAQKKAQKIKLSLGGFMEQWIGYMNDDIDDRAHQGTVNFDQKSDSEIHFRGSTTLDNGLKFGVKWELEGDDKNINSQGAFDEAMLYVSGSFGRINLGMEDNAAELMQYGAPSVGPITVNKSDSSDWVKKPSGFGSNVNSYQLDLGTSDNHKITYFTPRVGGFQFGVSYLPFNDNENDAQQKEETVGHNFWAVGANFVKKFGSVSVAVALGYMAGENTDSEAGRANEPKGWSTGVNIGFSGFTIGGGYIEEKNVGKSHATTTDTKQTGYNIGGSYKMGKNSFSLAWVHETTNASNTIAGDDVYEVLTFGYARNLGPGIDFKGSLARINWDGEDNTTTHDDNDGWAAVAGIVLSF